MNARKAATTAIRKTQARKDLPGIRRGQVIDVSSGGEITVRLDAAFAVLCDFVQTSATDAPLLRPGDEVLVVMPEGGNGKPAVLGKVGAYRPANRREVVIEADEELTIRCGQATIAFRKDGRILIKGAEIVSHARGRNRIRGGSVQIN